MTDKDALVKKMVDRFLCWKLPDDFAPDAGISFDGTYKDKWGMPVGTNLLNADQAKAMILHMLGDEAVIFCECGAQDCWDENELATGKCACCGCAIDV